jgi:predicted ATPase
MVSFKQFLLKEAAAYNPSSFDGKTVDKWSIRANVQNTTCAFITIKTGGGDYEDDLYLGILEFTEWKNKKYFYVELDDENQHFKTLEQAVKYIKSEYKIAVSTKVQEALLSTFAFELANGFS